MFIISLFGPTQEALMEKDRFVPKSSNPTDGHIESFEMIGKIVGVKRPEVLLMGKKIHNLRLVGVFSKRFKCWYNAFKGCAVANNVNSGKNYAAVGVHKGIMTRQILGPGIIKQIVNIPYAILTTEIATQYTDSAFIKRL